MDTEQLLQKTNANLQQCRSMLVALLGPEYAEWEKVSLDNYGSFLREFSLPAKLKISLLNFRKEYKLYSQLVASRQSELQKLEESISNQTAGHLIIESSSAALHAESQKLLREIQRITDNSLILVEAGRQVRQKISINYLLPLAKSSCGSARERAFDAGYRIFTLITDEEAEKKAHTNINDLFLEVTELETKFRNITFPATIPLAADIIKKQIGPLKKNLENLKNFIDSISQVFDKEMQQIKELRTELKEISRAPLAELLEKTDSRVQDLGKYIMQFSHKYRVEKTIDMIPGLLKSLKLCLLVAKSRLPENIAREMDSRKSLLNPGKLAEIKTQEYLSGAKGMARIIIFLFYRLFRGRNIVSPVDLQARLRKILENCEISSGNDEQDVQRLRDFLESHLHDYGKPFPYEGLLVLAKQTLVVYGEVMSRFIRDFPIENFSEDELQETSSYFNKTTFHELLGRVHDHSSELQKSKIRG